MILNAIDGKPLPIYGRGDNVRDWLHVEDHCAALRRAGRARPGSSYNIGGNCEVTNLEVVRTICDLVDEKMAGQGGAADRRSCRELIEYVTDRPGHDQRYAIDSSLIRGQLGWQPTHAFVDGLAPRWTGT